MSIQCLLSHLHGSVITAIRYLVITANARRVLIVIQVFSANKDCKKSTIVPLPFDVEAKYLRVVPVDFENEIALKLEVYGCFGISSVSAGKRKVLLLLSLTIIY